MDIKGNIIPLTTPLFPDERIDLDSLQKLMEFHIQNEASGIFVLGTNGEGVMIRDGEKEKLVVTCKKLIPPQMNLYVGAIENSLQKVLEQVCRIENWGGDVPVVLLPHYFKMSDDHDVESYLLNLADNSLLPLILYNEPSLTGKNITPSIIWKISQHPRWVGLKDTSYQLGNLQEIQFGLREENGFELINGDPRTLIHSLQLGARGVMVGSSNLDPIAIIRLINAIEKNDMEEALLFQKRIIDIRNIFIKSVSPRSSLKYLLQGFGLCSETVAQPTKVISNNEKKMLQQKIFELDQRYNFMDENSLIWQNLVE